MKNLAINDLSVKELTSKEARETNGGIATVVAVGMIVNATAMIAITIWKLTRRRIIRRRRR